MPKCSRIRMASVSPFSPRSRRSTKPAPPAKRPRAQRKMRHLPAAPPQSHCPPAATSPSGAGLRHRRSPLPGGEVSSPDPVTSALPRASTLAPSSRNPQGKQISFRLPKLQLKSRIVTLFIKSGLWSHIVHTHAPHQTCRRRVSLYGRVIWERSRNGRRPE